MPTDPNVDAIGVELARNNLKANVTNYASTALVQAVEIQGLKNLDAELLDSDAIQAELTERTRQLAIAESKRDAFAAALSKLPAASE